jgi:membrane protein
MTPSYATAPWAFTAREWWQILRRWFVQMNADNVGVAAAGVAFFSLLAIFPLMSAALSLYGYVADPADVRLLMNEAADFLPDQSRDLLLTQAESILSAPCESLGLGFIISLAIALFAAGSGIRALMRALNIAYGEVERRPIWKFYLLALGFTAMVGLLLALAVIAIVIIPATLEFIPLEIMDSASRQLARILPFVAVVMVFAAATFCLYRFGPDRRPAKKRWIWPGVLFATLCWLALSWAFSKFVADFSSYNATYGSIASVIILLIWFFLTTFVVVMGAELNAEMERQTLIDTTRGPTRPLGRRGANMADFLPTGLEAEDVKVEVKGSVIRPRHIRKTDMPLEDEEESMEAGES